jgi:choline dehydrogenase-like flavoprotein
MPCQHCGFCMAFGCEYGAKSSTLATVIPIAEKTGKCEVRPNSYVRKVEVDARGRATGVVYYDARKREQLQRARAVILRNGVETPRLLLNSKNTQFPNGLANSSGAVGKHLMFNGGATIAGEYEHQLNEYKSAEVTRLVMDWYDSDPRRGFYGGGGIDARFNGAYPIGFASQDPRRGSWGEGYRSGRRTRTRGRHPYSHTTSRLWSGITSPDRRSRTTGMPAPRVTCEDRPDDISVMRFPER